MPARRPPAGRPRARPAPAAARRWSSASVICQATYSAVQPPSIRVAAPDRASWAAWVALWSCGFLDYGRFEVERGPPARPDRRLPDLAPATGSCSSTPAFRRATSTIRSASGAEEGLDAFGRVVSLTPDNLPAAQLALAGIEPGDVTDLVITHGDIDHVGGLDGFPQATHRRRPGGARARPAAVPRSTRGPCDWPAGTALPRRRRRRGARSRRRDPVDAGALARPPLVARAAATHRPGAPRGRRDLPARRARIRPQRRRVGPGARPRERSAAARDRPPRGGAARFRPRPRAVGEPPEGALPLRLDASHCEAATREGAVDVDRSDWQSPGRCHVTSESESPGPATTRTRERPITYRPASQQLFQEGTT